MTTDEHAQLVANGSACPWCGHAHAAEDRPLRHGPTGLRYCNRDCFELDRRFDRVDNRERP